MAALIVRMLAKAVPEVFNVLSYTTELMASLPALPDFVINFLKLAGQILVLPLVYYLYKYLTYKEYDLRILPKPPLEKGLLNSILGHVSMLLRPDYHNVLLKWANTHGSIFKIRLLTQNIVVLSDPAAVTEIMGRGEGSIPSRSHHYGLLDLAAGATKAQGSLFGTDDEEHWRAVRKETVNAFSTSNLRTYQVTVNAAVSEMLLSVERESKALGSVEIDSLLMSMAMRVAVESQFQTTIKELDDSGGMSVAEGLEKMHYLMAVVNNMVMNPVTQWLYTSMYGVFISKEARKFAAVREEVRGMYRKLAQLVVTRPVAESGNTMLWACLQRLKDASGAPFNVEALIPDVGLFIIAGLDTSAVTIAWCLYCAALYPKHQEAVYQELLAAGLAGPKAHIPSLDDLSPLPITTAFINEVMRLYPTGATSATRITTKAVKIYSNKKNLLIPSGTCVWSPIYLLQNSTHNWDEARKFKPERWSGQDVQYAKGTKDKLRFAPFGQGVKGCIGQGLGQSMVKTGFLRMLASHKVMLHPEMGGVEDVDKWTVVAFTTKLTKLRLILERRK